MQRSLTGIKPSGNVHLGNYLGAIQPALALQQHYTAYYFIADYHALTTTRDADLLRASSRQIAATFLALGLDIDKHVFFRQSAVPEVCELTWILSCMIPPGQMDRGHAVKAAKDGGFEINVGVWLYPVLMAADILLYDANVVPVGKDQKQHVEICRDMATKVNHWYGEDTLVVPEVLIKKEVAVIPGLDGRKMSSSYGNEIPIWLPPKKLRKLIMKIKTASRGVNDAKDPDTCNVFGLYRHFATPEQVADLGDRYRQGGIGYGHAKQELFEVVDAELTEARERYIDLMDHPQRLEEALSYGAEKARRAAETTLDRIRSRVGLK